MGTPRDCKPDPKLYAEVQREMNRGSFLAQPDKLVVTQEDREAAAKMLSSPYHGSPIDQTKARIRGGHMDDHRWCQAFAAHRQRAMLKAAADEREAWQEALTPSGDTKADYHGEFSFTIPQAQEDEFGEAIEVQQRVYVPWTTVKEIMAAILKRAIRERTT